MFIKDLYEVTLDFSTSGVPTITKPLPLYKFIEQKLQRAIEELTEDEDLHNLRVALTAGLEKLHKHLKKSLDSHYPLLGAGMFLLLSYRSEYSESRIGLQ
jgi:hypothetical protein